MNSIQWSREGIGIMTTDGGGATRYGTAVAGESALRMAMSSTLLRDPEKFRTRVMIRPGTTRREFISASLKGAAMTFGAGLAFLVFTLILLLVRPGPSGAPIGWGDIFLGLLINLLGFATLLLSAWLCLLIAPFLVLRGFLASTEAKYAAAKDITKVEAALDKLSSGDYTEVDAGKESWAKGAAGEVAVGRYLESLPEGFEVAHDIEIVKNGTVRANIDHLVAGPAGIWVVDSKHWQGFTVSDGAGGIAGGDYKKKAPEVCAWEASHVQPGVTGIIIAVVGGTVQQPFEVAGPTPTVVMEAAAVPGFLCQRQYFGTNVSMQRIDQLSQHLRFR